MNARAAAGSVVMLSTGARGGIRAVIEAYAKAGMMERWNVRVLYSHVDGGWARRAGAGALAVSVACGTGAPFCRLAVSRNPEPDSATSSCWPAARPVTVIGIGLHSVS